MRGSAYQDTVTLRMGCVVDVVGYGKRAAREKAGAQERLAMWNDRVNDDVNTSREGIDRQGTGDGLMQFYPRDLNLLRALPTLLRSAVNHLADDNEAYRDRLQLRMAVDIGTVGLTSLGFSGETATRLGRLVDGQPLRQWLCEHPSHDLVTVLSDRLHSLVVGEGVPSLPSHQFAPVTVQNREATIAAWLWTPEDTTHR